MEGFGMNRWLLLGSMAGMLMISTGCLHHNTRGGCSTGNCGVASSDCGCGDSSCGNGACSNGSCGRVSGGGLLGKTRGRLMGCKTGCRTGCEAGPLGWQQGGLDYSSHLNPGLLGHGAAAQMQGQPFTPGAPSAQVAYPYYTHRGPRDFLLDNPPSIGP
jgi:hypothetical protein